MDFATLSRRMKGAQRARNVVTLMLGVSIAANLLLTWRISQENTQVVLIPSRVSDGMVARGAADVRYIEALSLDAVYAMYTVSPATIRYGRDVIERIAAAEDRARLLDAYDDIADDIKLRRISTVLRPEKIEHNLPRLQIVVEGMLSTYLDTTEVSAQRRRILLTFIEEGSSIRLSRMELQEVPK
ncbi:type IV conjugative transfer system protein TraE (plasmid) [Cereibacter azotoformans]|uniref:type IV conjugative transfer system protein TraE n=1 Tax=Cereibacter azotoformans TaxID=43057 RepID=UPI001EEAF27A|nr:type IV conjugative transfer system protein TraE [Cereibacter azotoformans]ULB12352.1 type IV conjugative transfer system protein TraE [Cereibacter azotoformans]